MDERERNRMSDLAKKIEYLISKMTEWQKGYILGVAETMAAEKPEPKKTA